jgi:hypothetical protein
MRVAVVTSVSANIAELAAATVPNKLEYCLRHGYSLIADNQPYEEAVKTLCDTLLSLLADYDLVWTLDSDAVITNMTVPIHTLECLGPAMTVCEEGIVDWNRINCGSVVWKSGCRSRYLIERLRESESEWWVMPCQQQTWLGGLAGKAGDLITVAPLRAFNSCAWNHPAAGIGEPGCHWKAGDLVYHPCGVYPPGERLRAVRHAIENGVIR